MEQPFELAVRQHGAAVLRVCRACLGTGPDAEDAWADTFAAALAQWPRLLADGVAVEAWLVRVAQRRCIDLIRARTRQPVPVAELPVQPSGDGVPDPEAVGLWQAVAQLPERQRLAVAGHYLTGLSHAETAELIGGSAESVRRAASDGIKRLRASHLANPTDEGPA